MENKLKILSLLSKGYSFKGTKQTVNVYKVIHDPNACRTWLAVFGDTSPRYKAEESIKGTFGHQNSPSLCDVPLHTKINQTNPATVYWFTHQ